MHEADKYGKAMTSLEIWGRVGIPVLADMCGFTIAMRTEKQRLAIDFKFRILSEEG